MDKKLLRTTLQNYLLTNADVFEDPEFQTDRDNVRKLIEDLRHHVILDKFTTTELIQSEMYHRVGCFYQFNDRLPLNDELIQSYYDDRMDLSRETILHVFDFVCNLWDENQDNGYNKSRGYHKPTKEDRLAIMKQQLQTAFEIKLKESIEYAESMLNEVGDETPAEHGVDPEFNIGEIIKELQSI